MNAGGCCIRRLLAAAGVGAALLCGAPAAAGAATITSPYVVVLQDSVVDVNATVNSLQSTLGFTPSFRYSSALKGFAANLTTQQVSDLTASSSVRYVTADKTFTATGLVATAAGETVPVGIRRIAASTSTQSHQSSGVNVAVLDTGIDLVNSDLNAVNGVNCITSTSTAADDNGHGTHVAGILGAKNSGTGVVGVAPATKLYAVKVLNAQKSGTLSQILCGINWVTANAAALNIKVASMSISGAGANDNNCGNTNNDSWHKAICSSIAKGVTYVAAAGNNGANFANYIPAAYPEVLTVTAMSDSDGVAGGLGAVPTCKTGEKDDSYGVYSNYAVNATEQAHTIAAPGTCVVSDKRGGGTAIYYGTSQAAPHVAGAVALCINDGGLPGPCASLTPAQTIAKLRSDAAAANSAFTGDPLRAITGKYYGYLVSAGGY